MRLAWLGAALVIAGRALLASKIYWAGWPVAASGDLCWIVFGWRRGLWPLVVLDVALLLCDVIGGVMA